MIIIHIEFDSFDQDYPLITWVKGSPGQPAGGTPSDHSGGHLSPGGECFAPFDPPVLPPTALGHPIIHSMMYHHTMTHHKIVAAAGLRTQHFNEHAIQTEPHQIPTECYSEH